MCKRLLEVNRHQRLPDVEDVQNWQKPTSLSAFKRSPRHDRHLVIIHELFDLFLVQRGTDVEKPHVQIQNEVFQNCCKLAIWLVSNFVKYGKVAKSPFSIFKSSFLKIWRSGTMYSQKVFTKPYFSWNISLIFPKKIKKVGCKAKVSIDEGVPERE